MNTNLRINTKEVTFKTGVEFESPRNNGSPRSSGTRASMSQVPSPNDLKLPPEVNFVALRETFLSDAPFIKRSNRGFWKKWIDSKQYFNVLASTLMLASEAISDTGNVLTRKLYEIRDDNIYLEKMARNISEMLVMDRTRPSRSHDNFFNKLPELLCYMIVNALLSMAPKISRLFYSVKFREILIDWLSELVGGVRLTNSKYDRDWLFADANDVPIIVVDPFAASKSSPLRQKGRNNNSSSAAANVLLNTTGSSPPAPLGNISRKRATNAFFSDTGYSSSGNNNALSSTGNGSGNTTSNGATPSHFMKTHSAASSARNTLNSANGNTASSTPGTANSSSLNNTMNNTGSGINAGLETNTSATGEGTVMMTSSTSRNQPLPVLQTRYAAARTTQTLANSPLIQLSMNLDRQGRNEPAHVCAHPLRITLSHMPERDLFPLQSTLRHQQLTEEAERHQQRFLQQQKEVLEALQDEILRASQLQQQQYQQQQERNSPQGNKRNSSPSFNFEDFYQQLQQDPMITGDIDTTQRSTSAPFQQPVRFNSSSNFNNSSNNVGKFTRQGTALSAYSGNSNSNSPQRPQFGSTVLENTPALTSTAQRLQRKLRTLQLQQQECLQKTHHALQHENAQVKFRERKMDQTRLQYIVGHAQQHRKDILDAQVVVSKEHVKGVQRSNHALKLQLNILDKQVNTIELWYQIVRIILLE